jgi:hypothetical protein
MTLAYPGPVRVLLNFNRQCHPSTFVVLERFE